jgi:hypothetical protein
LLVLGLLLYAFLHVNQIGLPDFVKRPLLEQLREHGAELDFSRMRVRLGRGIVIEHVNLGRARELTGEQIFADQLQLKLRWADLFQFHAPTITAVTVRGGQLTLPVTADTNAGPFRFTVGNIQARLRFASAESWELEQFEGTCHGGTFRATGSVTNVYRLVHPAKSDANPDAWKRILPQLGRALDRMTSAQPPTLVLTFHADLAEPAKSTAELDLSAAGVQSDFGRFGLLKLSLELHPSPATNGQLLGTLRVVASSAKTPWADVESLHLNADFDQSPTNALPSRLVWNLNLAAPKTRWAQAVAVQLSGTSLATNAVVPAEYATLFSVKGNRVATEWAGVTNVTFAGRARHYLSLPLTNGLPASLSWSTQLEYVHTRWGEVRALSLGVAAERVNHSSVTPEALPEGLRFLPDWQLAADVALTNLVSPKLELASASTSLHWSGERLTVSNLQATLYNGELTADLAVAAATRVAEVKVATSFDLHRISPLLGPAAEKWISQYGWPAERPVVLTAVASAVMPAWTNRAPNWNAELVPTLRLAGIARATNFSYRGLSGDSAVVPFSHTNRVWTVLGAQATRPEGRLEFDLTEWSATQDYHFRIHSTLDPQAVVPLFGPLAAAAMTNVQFTLPPLLDGEIWGRWHSPERTGVRATVTATNFVIRGEPVTELHVASATFTNQWLQVIDATVRQGTNTGLVAALGFDLAGNRLHFTNTVTTLDPHRVTRAIGPRTARALEPYLFSDNPHVVLNGIIPTRDNPQDADVRFETQAAGVRWWKLAATNLTTTVWWHGQNVSLINLDTGFHGGRLAGNVSVNLADLDDTKFNFDCTFQDVQLRSLLADMVPRTNRIDGLVSGRLTVNEAHSRTNGPWFGGGEARLRDGFLWDLPLFGGLSKALDQIVPGIGQTRFSSGSATFTITNRLIRTRDLEFRSPAMRLSSEGTVDFETQLDATMRAEVLRDVPLLGPIVSLALSPFSKLFEYEVHGALEKPVTELHYVPSLLLLPLKPFETIRGLLPADSDKPKSENKTLPTTP